MYYRLFDHQTGGYLYTGYNANSLQELAEDFKSYVEGDWEDGDPEINEETIQGIIESMEFSIEESETLFEENDETENKSI